MEQLKTENPVLVEQTQMQKVLDFALDMGRVLLKNGGEIFRVEETIGHICRRFDIEDMETFVLSNGIFITADTEQGSVYAKVKHIPLSAVHLGIVTEVNDLSREVSAGNIDLDDAILRLAEIEKMPPKRSYFRVLAAGLGSACFCYLLGGNLWESILTFGIGVLLYIFVIGAEKINLSRIIINIVGGALITVLAIGVSYLNLPFDLTREKMIIGSILPLVPGLAFVNAIRDIANSDYISGTVRIIDSLLVFVYIAIGVGTVLSGYNSILGGLLK